MHSPLELLTPEQIGRVANAVNELSKMPLAQRSAYLHALRSNGTAARLTLAPSRIPPAAPRTLDVSALHMEPVRWLWPGRIPLEEVCVIQGDPGLGKGHVCAELVARFTTARPMPDTGVAHPLGRVVWLTSEDDPQRVLKPRLVAAGAEVRLVSWIAESVSFPSGLDALRQLFR